MPNRIRPRRQACATWMLVLTPAVFSAFVVGRLESTWSARMEEWGQYAFVAASICAVLSPPGWILLRKFPIFCVSQRMHALQVSVWFLGWVLAPLSLAVRSL